jgi:hypothetical protein
MDDSHPGLSGHWDHIVSFAQDPQFRRKDLSVHELQQVNRVPLGTAEFQILQQRHYPYRTA